MKIEKLLKIRRAKAQREKNLSGILGNPNTKILSNSYEPSPAVMIKDYTVSTERYYNMVDIHLNLKVFLHNESNSLSEAKKSKILSELMRLSEELAFMKLLLAENGFFV